MSCSTVPNNLSTTPSCLLPEHYPGIIFLSEFILLNALSKAFWATLTFFHQKFCTPLIPGAVQLFLSLISFFSFSAKLIYNSDLLTKISFHLLHPWNIQCYFIFLPNIAPNFDKFLNVSQFSFSGLVSFQCFEKACLVTMELIVVLLSLSLFNTFFQFNFLVY